MQLLANENFPIASVRILEQEGGVVYLRFEEFTPTFPGEFLSVFLKNPTLTFKQTFTVVDEKGVRQKKY